MTKYILGCLLMFGCAVETTAPSEEAVEPTTDDSYEPVAGGGESTYRPNCVPDMAYTIGGKLVVVPGFCHPGDNDLRPIDPDPFEEGFKDPLTDPSGVLGLK